jgi:hypothetical protein
MIDDIIKKIQESEKKAKDILSLSKRESAEIRIYLACLRENPQKLLKKLIRIVMKS